jgi:hypothetical protein
MTDVTQLKNPNNGYLERCVVDRAVDALFRAVVADARSQPAALVEARREFLALAEEVGPTFQHRLIARAVERLLKGMPKAVPEDAARAVRYDCVRLFGADLCWCDLATLAPEGTA